MKPDTKTELVNFYKEQEGNMVVMCGDGANDCGAMLSSDVGKKYLILTIIIIIGISLCHNKANVVAHFYSQDDSISCIELVIKNGRACLENNIIIFKFNILIVMIQAGSVNFIRYLDKDFTEDQYLVFDLFCVLIPCFLLAK